MFEKEKGRYLTRGIDAKIPFDVQLYLWSCVDNMPEPKDYLQVLRLSNMNGMQLIEHTAENPKYSLKHLIPAMLEPVTEKVYIIDDGEYCTMLLAEEY